ncbi:MAG TPA: hypothetical protein PKC67_05300 [Kiritimatiellia bacterium]|nr:hypothetical protein [Kiritimatiellia bacterium]HMP33749.1 hypothetical protein [Kiritimatiellia bacterium]
MTHVRPLLLVATLLSAAFLVSGCDDANTNSQEIAIAPSSITLTNDKIWVVTFRAGDNIGDNEAVGSSTNIFYPLTWTVSDPGQGRFISQSGASAIYQTAGRVTGVNVINVRDQGGQEGQATVVLTIPAPPEPTATSL